VYTGALYNDSGLYNSGFLGEGMRGREVIAVKAHMAAAWKAYTNTTHAFDFEKCVFIMRNPLDAIVSERKRHVGVLLMGRAAWNPLTSHLVNATQVSTPPLSKFQQVYNDRWDTWVDKEIKHWANTYGLVLKFKAAGIPVHTVRHVVSRSGGCLPAVPCPVWPAFRAALCQCVRVELCVVASHPSRYEDLRSDPKAELRTLLPFLGAC
jgi:hypothetical protein